MCAALSGAANLMLVVWLPSHHDTVSLEAVLAANVMMNHDNNCQVWLANHRSTSDTGDPKVAARRERRTARRAGRDARAEAL